MKKIILISTIMILAGYSAFIKPMKTKDQQITGDLTKNRLESLGTLLTPRFLFYYLKNGSKTYAEKLEKDPTNQDLLDSVESFINDINASEKLIRDVNIQITQEDRAYIAKGIAIARKTLAPYRKKSLMATQEVEKE